jgi:uncharacterized membrane protein
LEIFIKIDLLNQKELKEIIRFLPSNERQKLLETKPDPTELEKQIANCKEAMRLDAWFGIPWVILYGLSLLLFGFNAGTIALLIIGIAFFTYRFFTSGSYGLNRKRVKVYQKILDRLQKKS